MSAEVLGQADYQHSTALEISFLGRQSSSSREREGQKGAAGRAEARTLQRAGGRR